MLNTLRKNPKKSYIPINNIINNKSFVGFGNGTTGIDAPNQADPDYGGNAAQGDNHGRVIVDDGVTKTTFIHIGASTQSFVVRSV